MSNYPERPVKKGRPKSSQSGGGKRQGWLQLAVAGDGRKGPKLAEARIDLSSYKPTDYTVLKAFTAKYAMNKAGLHEYGRKGRTLLV